MTEESELVYEGLSAKCFKVTGSPREKYEKALKNIGAIWNPRQKPVPGWYINRNAEEALKNVIESFKKILVLLD